MPESERQRMLRSLGVFTPLRLWALLLVAGFVVYAPALLNEYLFADDYPQFCERQDWRTHMPYGRPLLGALFLLIPDTPRDLASFLLLRVFSSLSAATFVWLLWQTVLRRFLPERAALPATLGCLALPTFHFCIGASTAYPIVLAACASLGAGALAVFVLCYAANSTTRVTTVGLAVAALLELACLATYQPAAMCYWLALTPVAMDARFLSDVGFRKRATGAFAVGAAAIAIYFGVFKLAATLHWIESPVRAGLTTDVVGKLAWFIEKPLLRALSLWGLYEWRYVVACGAVCVLVFGARAVVNRRGEAGYPSVARLLTLSSLLMLCYAPVLATAESWPSYRSLVALSVFVYVLTLAAVHRVYLRSSAASRSVLAGGGCLTIVAALISANRNVADNLVAVQRAELGFLLASLERPRDSSPPRAVHVVLSPFDRGADFPCRSDEFGVRSASRPRWATDMTRCAQRLLGLHETPVTTSAPGVPAPLDDDVLVVDMNRIQWVR